ncbi:MAG: recombinase family protein [Lachnospiraceae bacterium]|nr:recombinase family protein [Lachnospiraceae bacterium]
MGRSREQKYTALYERLSRDDEQVGESNSIINQKIFLEDYAMRNHLGEFRHFTDDGYSGVSFERPGFNQLLEEIRAGKVGCLVVKDLSRLGRNYLQVGYFTEIMFPDAGVRFIAVNNSVDSANGSENEMTPFINIMNEWYAKDTSRKIRAMLRTKMEQGRWVGNTAPFGYKLDKKDPRTFVVDEEAAKTVRRVFEMARNGRGVTSIAYYMRQERWLIPAAYAQKNRPDEAVRHKFANEYGWTASTVRTILSRKEYLGHLIMGRTTIENFKTKKVKYIPEEEQFIFYDNHEPLVDKLTWDIAQYNTMKGRRPRVPGPKKYKSHRLSSFCFCAQCGKRMTYRSPNSAHRAGGRTYNADSAFICSRYRSAVFNGDCTMHYIRSIVVEEQIAEELNYIRDFIKRREEVFLKLVRSVASIDQERDAKQNRGEMQLMETRVEELDKLIKKLYEDSSGGRISERLFQKLMRDYDDEQRDLEQKVKYLKIQADEIRDQRKGAEKFARILKSEGNFTKVSDRILNDLIQKVVIHEPTGKGKNRIQHVEIFYNYVGRINLELLKDNDRDDAIIPEKKLSLEEMELNSLKAEIERLSD